ncbi:MAG: ATP-binding protein [Kouleothrix sp.]|nr:ATP-binding protein [Kouleothrix sp.]
MDQAQRDQLAIVDSYDRVGLPPIALVACACAAGADRQARWRGLPVAAEGVTLRSGRVKVLAAQSDALTCIRAFVKRPRGWLTLAGAYGVGKTTLIYAALNALADKGKIGRYIVLPDLLDQLKAALRKDDHTYDSILRRVAMAPILAVDEVTAIRESDWTTEVLQTIFLSRYEQRASTATFLGYNVDGAQRLPAFLRSRLSDARFMFVDLGGKDLRPIADQLDPWDRGEGER